MRKIDADALKDKISNIRCYVKSPVMAAGFVEAKAKALREIEAAPTVEFEPGQWIDKNELIDKLDIMISNAILSDTAIHYALVREMILQQKAIDTMPRAQWVSCGRDSAYNSYIKCSHCNHEVVMYADSIKAPPKYCEECGYRMDANDTNGGGEGGADNG